MAGINFAYTILVFLLRQNTIFKIFSVTHSCGLLFHFSQLSGWLTPLSAETFWIYFCCGLFFTLGGIRFYRTNKSNVVERIEYVDCDFSRLIYALFAIFISAYFYEASKAEFVLPIFAANKLSAYYNFPQPIVHYLFVNGVIIATLIGCKRYILLDKSRIDFPSFLVICILLICILARALQVLSLVGFYHFKYIQLRRYAKIRLAIMIGFALLAFITLSGTVRTGQTSQVILIIGKLDEFWINMLPLAWTYLYFSTTIENFDGLISSNFDEYKFGLISFIQPIATFLQLKDLSFFEYTSVLRRSQGFNGAPYVYHLFIDFGYLSFIGSFIYGKITILILNSTKKSLIIFQSIWFYAVFSSVTINYFYSFCMIFYVIVIVFSVKLFYLRLKLK